MINAFSIYEKKIQWLKKKSNKLSKAFTKKKEIFIKKMKFIVLVNFIGFCEILSFSEKVSIKNKKGEILTFLFLYFIFIKHGYTE